MPATKVKERTAKPQTPSAARYDIDFYSWTAEQAAALREGDVAALDRENLAGEIEDLGKALFSELRSHFRVILVHMLKWDQQPERRSRSWVKSNRTHRNDVRHVSGDTPSLRRRQQEAVERAYENARLDAATEMERDDRTLPERCPYPLDDILDREFHWPQD